MLRAECVVLREELWSPILESCFLGTIKRHPVFFELYAVKSSDNRKRILLVYNITAQ